MIIKKIEVYGFGKWSNETFHFQEGSLQLVFGENEAGKSTLMAFIQAIFYGFPKKNERAKSYEPLHQNQYGGAITIWTKSKGVVRIERVKRNRVRGDVTVQFSDGSESGEEALQSIMGGLNEAAFQGIFSFNLKGLQGLENMKAEEINEFLYDTAITGGPSLLSSEKEAETQMQDLFKARGKKTPVNQQLRVLQEQDKRVQEWQRKLADYRNLVANNQQLEESLLELEKQKQGYEQQVLKWERVKKLLPLQQRYRNLQAKLDEEPALSFPEKGEDRLDRTLEKKKEWEGFLEEENERMHLLENKVSTLRKVVSNDWESSQLIFQKLNKQSGVYTEQQRTKTSIIEKLRQLKKERNFLEDEWGWGIEKTPFLLERKTTRAVKDELASIDTRVKKSEHEWTSLKTEEKHLEQEYRRLSGELTDTEKKLLSNDKRERYYECLSRVQEYESVKPQLAFMENRQELLQAEDKRSSSIQQLFDTSLVRIGIGSILLLLGGWIGFTNDWVIGTVIGVIGITFVLASLGRKQTEINNNNSTTPSEKHHIQLELEKWASFQDEIDQWPVEEWKHLLKVDEQFRQKVEQIQLALQQWERRKAENATELQRTCDQLFTEKRELNKWAINYGFDEGFTGEQYQEMMQDSVKWKELYSKELSLNEQLAEIESMNKEFRGEVKKLASSIGVHYTGDDLHALYQIENWLIDQKESQSALNQHIDHLEEANVKKKAAISRISKQDEEIGRLFKEAQVTGEEEFRARGEQVRVNRKKYAEKESLMLQMKAISPSERLEDEMALCEMWGEKIEEKQQEVQQHRHLLNQKHRTAVEQVTEMKQDLKVLEDGQTYQDCLQSFEMEKKQLQTMGKQWAVYAVAKEIIQKTKQVYEKERQPAVIQRAEFLFQKLTNGAYVRLFAPLGEMKFIVERQDGERFEPVDLSQGTCELLYLSIRFSLATLYQREEAFPLIIDEAFVNFDASRRKRVMNVLKELAEDHQVIYFTCHEYVVKEEGLPLLSLDQTIRT